jgi:Spy/CpxP family protein refolding chaperone
MKHKLIALATGAILSLATLNAGLVKAESSPLAALSGLDLTAQQQTQLTELRQQTRAEVEQILTPEQREQFKTVQLEMQNLRSAIAALNLTPQQKDQIRQILFSARTEFSSILTPEQRQQLRGSIRSFLQQR